MQDYLQMAYSAYMLCKTMLLLLILIFFKNAFEACSWKQLENFADISKV